jgi:hypothetical protein
MNGPSRSVRRSIKHLTTAPLRKPALSADARARLKRGAQRAQQVLAYGDALLALAVLISEIKE